MPPKRLLCHFDRITFVLCTAILKCANETFNYTYLKKITIVFYYTRMHFFNDDVELK